MPRKPRFIIPGVPVHVVQRGRSREAVFHQEHDYQAYLVYLKDGAERYQCSIHAYVLMTNHIHILATPKDGQGITQMMQYIGTSLRALHQPDLRRQRFYLGRSLQSQPGTGRSLFVHLYALY